MEDFANEMGNIIPVRRGAYIPAGSRCQQFSYPMAITVTVICDRHHINNNDVHLAAGGDDLARDHSADGWPSGRESPSDVTEPLPAN